MVRQIVALSLLLVSKLPRHTKSAKVIVVTRS